MGVLRRARIGMYVFALMMAGLMASAPALDASATSGLQLHAQKIKAGLVYNFLKHTTWNNPASPQHLRICFLGGDLFDGFLAPLEGRTAQQKPIEIIHLSDISGAASCSIVAIDGSRKTGLRSVLNYLSSYQVLTVSDIPGFAKAGGMVELSMGRDQRIHLRINNQAIASSGLVIHDRLLKLAEPEQ